MEAKERQGQQAGTDMRWMVAPVIAFLAHSIWLWSTLSSRIKNFDQFKKFNPKPPAASIDNLTIMMTEALVPSVFALVGIFLSLRLGTGPMKWVFVAAGLLQWCAAAWLPYFLPWHLAGK